MQGYFNGKKTLNYSRVSSSSAWVIKSAISHTELSVWWQQHLKTLVWSLPSSGSGSAVGFWLRSATKTVLARRCRQLATTVFRNTAEWAAVCSKKETLNEIPPALSPPSHRKVRNTQREREKQTQKIKTYIFIPQPPPVRRGEEWMSWEAGDLKKWKVNFWRVSENVTAINQSQRRRKKLYTSRTTYRFSSVEVAPSCPKSTPRTRKKKIPGWFSKSGEAPEALPCCLWVN